MAATGPPRRGMGGLVHGPPGHPLHPPLTDATIGMFVLATALGVIGKAGAITDEAGSAMWLALIGGLIVAVPTAAVGPGGGAILWAENVAPVPLALLAVALLRAAATTAAAASGGCGGVFVPFLAVGDIAGRVFAPGLGIGGDLAGAAGAAAGIASGYRLPFTAIAMAFSLGGPRQATYTCLAAIVVAAIVGAGAGTLVDRLVRLPYLWKRRHAPA
jgi:H+/Cl- antiporter ClcA